VGGLGLGLGRDVGFGVCGRNMAGRVRFRRGRRCFGRGVLGCGWLIGCRKAREGEAEKGDQTQFHFCW
jgi:hypothetical protein